VSVEGGFVNVDLIITQDSLIGQIERREKTETSCAYDSWIDHTSGIWRGMDGKGEPEPYDVIQRGHINNHIAITKRGRGGREIRLHLDSEDAIAVDESSTGEQMKITLDIDGAGVEMEPGAAAIIKEALGKRDTVIAESKITHDSVVKEKDTLQAKHDQLETDLKETKEKLELKVDSMEPAELSKLVKARAELVNKAGTLLDKEEMLTVDAADDIEVMRAAVRKHTKLKLTTDKDDADYKSDGYVTARFDALFDARSQDGQTRLAAGVVAASLSGGQNETRLTLDSRIEAAMASADNAWKGGNDQSGPARVKENN
jgi:hypothetical protein